MEECFVCADTVPPPWPSACRCRDRFIHEACLKKLLETHGPCCTVCKERFSNVVVEEKCVFRPSLAFCAMWLMFLAEITIGASIVKTTLVFFETPFGSMESVMLLFVIICFCLIFVGTSWRWLVIFRHNFRLFLGFASRNQRSTYRIEAPRAVDSIVSPAAQTECAGRTSSDTFLSVP